MHSGSDYKTPPQSSQHVPEDIDNTPPNHGTACIAEYQINTAIDDIKENVIEDLQNTEECEIEIMLQAMLRIIAQKTDDSVGNQKWAEAALEQCLETARIFLNQSNNQYTIQLRSGIKAYCDGTNECDRYKGTVSALNAIICHFRSEPNQETLPTELRVPEENLATIFKINDPRVIQPNPPRVPNYRKPDIIQLDWKTARVFNGDDHLHDSFENTVHCANTNYNPNPREQTEDNKKLRWDDVLMTFELKKKKSLKDRDIPAEYQSGRLTHENTKSRLKPPRSGLEVDLSSAHSRGNSTPTKVRRKSSMKFGSPAGTSQLDVRKTRSSSTAIGSSSLTVNPSSPTTAVSPIIALSSSATGSASTGARSAIAESSPKTHSSESRKRGLDQVVSERSDSRKARKVSKSRHPAVQSAIYAAERLSTGAWIKCAVGVVLLDNELYLVMYDRQSPLAARGFDFITNLPHFVILSLILQRLASCHWDSIAFRPAPETRLTLEGQLASIWINDREFRFRTADASTLYVLNGRGTTGVPITEAKRVSGPETELPLFLKMSWLETIRQREDMIIERIKEVGRECTAVLDHVPNLLAFETLTVHSTLNIRTLLRLHPTDRRDCSRVLCCAVFERLRPLTELKGMEFWKAYWDIIAVHHTLWQKGIQHCDVSISNLMYRMKDGTLKGVLNDYDLSRLSTGSKREGSPANDRTGTIPFMAIDLLSQEAEKGMVRHLYHHDLESFAWVLFWVVSCYDEGKEILRRPDPFANWHISASLVYREKLAFLNQSILQFHPSWKRVNGAVYLIHRFWRRFYYEQIAARELKEFQQLPDLVTVDEDDQGVQQGDRGAQQGMNKDVELLRELAAFLADEHGGKKLPGDVLQCLQVGLTDSNDLLPL